MVRFMASACIWSVYKEQNPRGMKLKSLGCRKET